MTKDLEYYVNRAQRRMALGFAVIGAIALIIIVAGIIIGYSL